MLPSHTLFLSSDFGFRTLEQSLRQLDGQKSTDHNHSKWWTVGRMPFDHDSLHHQYTADNNANITTATNHQHRDYQQQQQKKMKKKDTTVASVIKRKSADFALARQLDLQPGLRAREPTFTALRSTSQKWWTIKKLDANERERHPIERRRRSGRGHKWTQFGYFCWPKTSSLNRFLTFSKLQMICQGLWLIFTTCPSNYRQLFEFCPIKKMVKVLVTLVYGGGRGSKGREGKGMGWDGVEGRVEDVSKRWRSTGTQCYESNGLNFDPFGFWITLEQQFSIWLPNWLILILENYPLK